MKIKEVKKEIIKLENEIKELKSKKDTAEEIAVKKHSIGNLKQYLIWASEMHEKRRAGK